MTRATSASDLRTMLQRLGIVTTWQEACGEDAIKSYQQHLPDVVLLDVNLPRMSGTEIFRRLVELDPDVAVVVVTADQSGPTIREISKLGAVGYVLKHLAPVELQKALAEALHGLSPGRTLRRAEVSRSIPGRRR